MKKILYIAGGVIGAVVLAAAVFVLTFDVNKYRPRIEAAASEATGLDVKIGGEMGLTVLPDIGVSIEGLDISNKGRPVASAKRVAVGVELVPLLHREVKVKGVEVDSPEVSVVKFRNGRYNFETDKKKPEKKKAGAPLKVARIAVRDGHVVYADERSGGKTDIKQCGLTVENLSAGGGDFMKTASFDAEMTCGEVGSASATLTGLSAELNAKAGVIGGKLSCDKVKTGKMVVSDISADIKTEGGRYEAEGVRLKVFGGAGSGRLRYASSGGTPEYTVDLSLAGLKVEDALAAFDRKKSMRGPLDLNVRMTMRGKTAKDFERTASGDFSVRGNNLAIEGMDLDQVLDKYEKSQSVSLFDVGSTFILGPIGPLLTKGYDFGGVYQGTLGGETAIRQFVSDWKVGGGYADAKDVAFSTRRNRVAMKGRLNLVAERYDGITVAALDKDGYATFTQNIQGDFRHPHVEKISTVKAIAGSILGLFEKAKGLFAEEKREVFYRGSVKHPK